MTLATSNNTFNNNIVDYKPVLQLTGRLEENRRQFYESKFTSISRAIGPVAGVGGLALDFIALVFFGCTSFLLLPGVDTNEYTGPLYRSLVDQNKKYTDLSPHATGAIASASSLAFGILLGLVASRASSNDKVDEIFKVWNKVIQSLKDQDGRSLQMNLAQILRVRKQSPDVFNRTIEGVDKKILVKALHILTGYGCLLKVSSLNFPENTGLLTRARRHFLRAGAINSEFLNQCTQPR